MASDARLHAIADEGNLAAFELDFEGETSWFSGAWLRLLGGVEAPANGPAALADALPPGEGSGGPEAWLLAQAPGQSSFSRVVNLRTSEGKSVPAILGINRTLTRKRGLSRVVGFAFAIPDAALVAARAGRGSLARLRRRHGRGKRRHL